MPHFVIFEFDGVEERQELSEPLVSDPSFQGLDHLLKNRRLADPHFWGHQLEQVRKQADVHDQVGVGNVGIQVLTQKNDNLLIDRRELRLVCNSRVLLARNCWFHLFGLVH